MKKDTRVVQFVINGDAWKFHLMPELLFIKKHPDNVGSAALTIAGHKCVDFCKEDLSEDILLHELLHVYFSYLCLDDTNEITIADSEEIFVNFFIRYHDKILKAHKTLWKFLTEESGEIDD